MLLSVLNVWGQADTFYIKKAKEDIDSLKLKTERIVIVQVACANKISDQDKINARPTLDSTFALIDTVLTYYDSKEKAWQQKAWQQKADTCISDFIRDYTTNIHDKSGNVSVSTSNCLKTARKALNTLKQLCKEKKGGEQTPSKGGGEDNTSPKKSMWDTFKQAITAEPIAATSCVLCILCVVACVRLFVLYNKAKRKTSWTEENVPSSNSSLQGQLTQLANKVDQLEGSLKSLKNGSQKNEQFERMGREITQLRKEIDALKKPTTPSAPPSKGEEKNRGNEKEKAEKEKQKFYLYADPRQSSKELYKISGEKSNEKVFVLELESEDAKVAELTINHNMTEERMKHVIGNRQVFLPATVCTTEAIGENESKIVPISKGIAKKIENDKWVVETPMHIRIE